MSPLSVPLNVRSLLLLIVLSILYLLGLMTPLVFFCFRDQCGWLLATLASPNFDLRRLTVSLGSFW